MEIRQNVALKDWSWWKIGGPADYFCLPTSIDEVREAIVFAHSRGLPVTVLGGGTNVLISDQGVAGLVIGMKQLRGLEVKENEGRVELVAMAGAPKSDLLKVFLARRLSPALFLCGLPGDVGGGVVMNAGVAEDVQPREFVELVDWVEVMSMAAAEPELRRLNRSEITWSYRQSRGWQPGVVVRVGLSWPLEPNTEIPRLVKAATKSRLQRQPLDLPSCGSTFKNPSGQRAGQLIDQAGLKGYRVGDAQVSTKHANFIVNLGAATAADVLSVIAHVQTTVRQRFAIELETEVRLLGR